MRRTHLVRSFSAAAILGCGLLGGTLGAGQAHAAYSICRTDPTVVLSNGISVTMWAEIGADASAVQQVSYVLHVPHKLTIRSISKDQYGALESVSLVQDQNGNRYVSETQVTTTINGVNVTAYATLSAGQITGSAKGHNGDKLIVRFQS